MKISNFILNSTILLLFAFITSIQGQEVKQFNLEIKGDAIPIKNIKEQFNNYQDLESYLSELKNELVLKGYLSASFDSITNNNSNVRAHFYLGRLYELNSLTYKQESEAILNGSRKFKNLKKVEFNRDEIFVLQSDIIDYLGQSGYPFAAINFDSLVVADNKIDLSMNIEKGPLIKFDTITNVYKNKVSIGYLKAFTGIFPGKPYNENLIKTLDSKLQEIPFLQMERNSEIYFKNDEAKVNLFLKPNKVNRFDFLFGVLPNSTTNGKVLITGDVNVKLLNPFGTGKRLDINWKRLKPQSQDLRLYFDYPFIAASPLGADIGFTLNKRDTSYINITYNIGINYQVRPGERITLFVDNEQSLLLSVDSNRLKFTKQLPDVLDSRNTLFGLSFAKQNLDYIFNPRSGYSFVLSAFAGNKRIKPSELITSISDPTFSFEDIYDQTELKSIKWGFGWQADYYQPLGQRQTFHFKVMGRTQQNNVLLENELYRIGGNQNLRGFDEEIFLVSTYNIVSAEYRLLTGKNAFFQVFFDFGMLNNKINQEIKKFDFPFGFGTGVNLETKAGIFGLSYALGRSSDIPLQFRSAKIHFGYVNMF